MSHAAGSPEQGRDRATGDDRVAHRADDGADVTQSAPSAAAALFDLRTVIAILFGLYGIILTILGLVSNDPAELEKAGGIDLNLWTGIGMLVIAALFVTWERLRPQMGPRSADDR